MKKLVIIFLTICFLFITGFYFLSFFIPRVVKVELANSNSAKNEAGETLPRQYLLAGFESIKKDFLAEKKSFLEVNLAEMKVRVYQDGVTKKEVPILAKGDPQGWGGSAAGLYQVITKASLSYSAIAGVYMPYAIRFYGKYYLHGEPYYPGGERRLTDTTGGCLQLKNDDAKVIYDLIDEEMPVLVIDKENDSYNYFSRRTTKFPEVSAKSYLVADLDSGFVFAQKNPREVLPVASLVKLMTAVVVSEYLDLRETILVEPEMLKEYGSTKGLEANKSFRVVELFYPLLLESSNDAAEVLSSFLGREKTIQLMNGKARAIMMPETSFYDPSGFDPKNTSTGQDIFYLIRYILNNRPPILTISRGEKVLSFGTVRFTDLKNKNIFFDAPDFIGGKSGYIVSSNYTGAFVFRFKQKEAERRIAIILLGSGGFENGEESLKNEVPRILDWLRQNYSEK